MITKKRKGAETRRDAVRRQFREAMETQSPNPGVQILDSHGRPRKRRRRILVPVQAG